MNECIVGLHCVDMLIFIKRLRLGIRCRTPNLKYYGYESHQAYGRVCTLDPWSYFATFLIYFKFVNIFEFLFSVSRRQFCCQSYI